MRVRDSHAFEQRKSTIESILDSLGDVRVEGFGKRDRTRGLEIQVDSPRPPMAAEARFRYLEWWGQDERGWRLVKYQYDYIDLVRRSRLAYHRHDLLGAADSLHSHCEPSPGRRLVRHFRAYEVDLLEAHEEFAVLYASGQPIDCAGLRQLHVTQGADA